MDIQIPLNSTCESYFHSSNFNLSIFFLNYFISQCLKSQEGMNAGSGSKGVDEFLTIIAKDYFMDSPQIVLLYDESWDISEMIMKLTEDTDKAFVSYFLPLDETISQRIKRSANLMLLTMQLGPPDHFTHKLLPKANAFIIFVKDEQGFLNILDLISAYPWWNKRARVIIMLKEKSTVATNKILAKLESEKIFNGVVVSQLVSKDNSTASSLDLALQQQQQNAGKEDSQENATKNITNSYIALQVVALEPYPDQGHNKESYIGRWVNGELQTVAPIFKEKIDNLRGNQLQICVFEFPPLVIKTEVAPGKYEYSGLEVNLLKELARLLNFTFAFYEPPEGERWGVDLGNNNWTGLIGETQRNADFGFASVFLLDNREMAVDVSTPYDQDQGCFAVPRPEALQHWLGLVLPFSWQVWACVISLAFVAGPIFTLITRPLGMDRSMTIGRGILYALGSLVSAQKPPQAKSHALRSFIVAWLVFCWLAAILYRVALIVSLTVGPNAFQINTLKQLVRSGLEWGGYPEIVKTFSNTSEVVDEDFLERLQIVTNATEALDRVATKGDFALMDSGKLLKYAETGKYFDGYSSMIHVTKECPARYNVGFVMPIGSPFLEKTNELIRRLQNAGIIEKWYDDILHEAAVKNPNRGGQNKRREKGLDIGDLKLCLVLVLCGHFSAFLILLGEHGLAYYRSGKAAEVGSSLIRRVSTMSGLSSLSSRDGRDMSTSVNPSVIITETEDTSCSQETLRSLPVEMEHGWCQCFEQNEDADAVSASLGDIKAISCPHIIKNFEEE